MKKIILTLIIILIAVYAAFSLLGIGGEYAAEKLFYRAMKANEKIVINPDVAPPKLLASVENNLQKILKKYPDSNTAKGARMALSEFYLYRKKYDEAFSILNAVIDTEDVKTESKDIAMLSKAHFYKGIIYEQQNQWGNALKEYTILRDEYTATALGLQIPLYIGRYYKEKGETAEADKAYNEAARFYEELERNNRGKVLGYAASTLLGQTYMTLEQYEQAGKVVEDTINNYPADQTFAQQLPLAESIFVKMLKRPEKAVEIYKYVQEKTNNKELKEILKKKIGELESQLEAK